MIAIVIGLGGALAIFIVSMLLLPKSATENALNRRQELLSDLERSRQETLSAAAESMQTIRHHDYNMSDALEDLSPFGRVLIKLPMALYFYRLMVQTGQRQNANQIGLVCAGAGLVITYFFWDLIGPLALLAALGIVLFGLRWYLNMRVAKRTQAFLDKFADGIDMIVRAIRAGNPVNNAMRLVAEHGESPVKEEFRIVIDEVTYGRPLVEALQRLAKRVPAYDVSFFVVVLTVQQETGGNLGEVLGKLSYIIRKRQELYLKVRAITSEGRASAWILGALPVALCVILYVMSPEYMTPLFTTFAGKIILALAMGFILAGFFVIRKLAQIEV